MHDEFDNFDYAMNAFSNYDDYSDCLLCPYFFRQSPYDPSFGNPMNGRPPVPPNTGGMGAHQFGAPTQPTTCCYTV